MKKIRYAYILLVIMSLLVGTASVLISIHQVQGNNEKFCHLVEISNLHPIPVASIPPNNPISQRALAMYNAYNDFGNELGCKYK